MKFKTPGFWFSLPAGAVISAGLIASAHATPIQTVFTIAMENHNFTQPSTMTSIQQIQGNVAAPYINSLVTPGNANSQYTSYFSNLTNVASGVHPSEPNYIWQAGGSNFGTANDNDPSAASHNIETATSLTGQLTQKGTTWKSYQEDAEYSSSVEVSASGTGGMHNGNTVVANPYNGSLQYNFVAKHDPISFYTDSLSNPNNGLSFGQLSTDLANNTYAQYNWITPNQYNDLHSALSGGFTYNGTHYTGDQAAVAQGDHFLSIIVPEIEATTAFQDGTGVIELWWDESEGGDTSAYTIPEIIISKAAVGNAYDVTTNLTHSGSLLTDQEIFQTGSCLLASCGATDLSQAFVAGAIPETVPEPASLALLGAFTVALVGMRRRRSP